MDFYTNVFTYGNRVFVRGVNSRGAYIDKVEYQPTLYLNSQTESEYKLLDGTYVKPIQPGTIRDCKDLFERYTDVQGFDVYGQNNYGLQYISDTYPGKIEYDINKIRIHTVDIETQSEFGFPEVKEHREKILLIGIHDSITNKTTQFGWKEEHTPADSSVTYIKCSDEEQMLRRYIDWHCANYPDILTGWYSDYFDIPYICRRIEKVLGESFMKRLSPFGMVENTEKMFMGEMEYMSKISGIACVDYLDLYKKFIFDKPENYKLDTIAEIELNDNKLANPYPTFKEFYSKDYTLFSDYNAKDVQIVTRLENKLKLLEVMFTIAYMAKINFEDVFSPVKTWDTLIYNYLREKNVVIPNLVHKLKQQYDGAYVKEPIPGRYKWIVSFDLQSLYPHLIMQYAMSTENLVPGNIDVILEDLIHKKTDLSFLKNKDVAMAANGSMYKRQAGLFPDLMEMMFNQRSVAKKEMLKLKQEKEELLRMAAARGLF